MSVLIKNTTMPKNCIECPMQFGGWCYVCPSDIDERVAETVEEAVKQGKPDWCPLVEIEGDDVAPVVHGRWIECDYKYLEHGCIETDVNAGLYCSNCRTAFKKMNMTYKLHCPSCGAKMDESEDSGDD